MLVGNDIVALNDKDNITSFNRAKYLMKISLPTEIIVSKLTGIKQTAFLWSIKESAYKLTQKHLSSTSFHPKHYQLISCNQLSENNFQSSIEYIPLKLKLYAITQINNEYIHTIMVLNQEHLNYCHYQTIKYASKTSQLKISKEIKKTLIQNVSSSLGINPSGKINITKNKHGIPYLLLNNKTLNSLDISISHDGEFGAYAFLYFHQNQHINNATKCVSQ